MKCYNLVHVYSFFPSSVPLCTCIVQEFLCNYDLMVNMHGCLFLFPFYSHHVVFVSFKVLIVHCRE